MDYKLTLNLLKVQFPKGTTIRLNGGLLRVVSWNEDGSLCGIYPDSELVWLGFPIVIQSTISGGGNLDRIYDIMKKTHEDTSEEEIEAVILESEKRRKARAEQHDQFEAMMDPSKQQQLKDDKAKIESSTPPEVSSMLARLLGLDKI